MADEVAKSMTLLPEYQEKFLKDLLANVYQVDEATGMITGIAAKNPLEGTPRVDAQGNPIYKRDAQGNILKDQFGAPVQEFEGGVPRPELIRFTDPQRKALEMGQAGIGAYKPLMAEAERTLGSGLGAYQQGVSALGGTTAAFDPMSYRAFYDPFVEDVIRTLAAPRLKAVRLAVPVRLLPSRSCSVMLPNRWLTLLRSCGPRPTPERSNRHRACSRT